MRPGAALLLLILLPGGLLASDTDVDAEYHRAVRKYNAHILERGSFLGEEAMRLKEDMDALRERSERLRGERGDVVVATETASAPPSAELPPAEPGPAWRSWAPLALEIVLACALLGVLSLFLYRVAPGSWGGRAVIRCPHCRRKLRVPKAGKRLRVRCPDCGEECAYNPKR